MDLVQMLANAVNNVTDVGIRLVLAIGLVGGLVMMAMHFHLQPVCYCRANIGRQQRQFRWVYFLPIIHRAFARCSAINAIPRPVHLRRGSPVDSHHEKASYPACFCR